MRKQILFLSLVMCAFFGGVKNFDIPPTDFNDSRDSAQTK